MSFQIYLEKFGDRPHKLSEELLLLLIEGYGTDNRDISLIVAIFENRY